MRYYDATRDAEELLEKTLKRKRYNQVTLGEVKQHLAEIVSREMRNRRGVQ